MLDFTIILQSLDYLGTFAFGVSGAMVAVRKKMDVFGVVVLAMVTAIGGGTVRDLLLARTPNFWIEDPTYIYLAIIAGLIPFIAYHAVERGMTALIFFDAVGLGAFTVIGAWLGIEADVAGIAVVVLATLTGIGGGMMRDVLAREVPIVLREEIYASACIAGAAVFLLAIRQGAPVDVAAPITVVLVVVIRMLSHAYKWELPHPKHTKPRMN
ncbi:MAG: trimeric intracellular cation channel family protein [Armatimonadota bacterium]